MRDEGAGDLVEALGISFSTYHFPLEIYMQSKSYQCGPEVYIQLYIHMFLNSCLHYPSAISFQKKFSLQWPSYSFHFSHFRCFLVQFFVLHLVVSLYEACLINGHSFCVMNAYELLCYCFLWNSSHGFAGIMTFEMEYGHWVEEQHKQNSELRTALQAHVTEIQLRMLVESSLSHYYNLFRMKADAAKADVFYLISGVWRTSAERFFLWIGGFRPSELLNVILYSH